eukprot:jgi/Botrbrau1/4290/Bobra.0390s0030.1
MIGFMIVFHSASCGYFFCTRFPGILDYPRDIYDDLRDIHILRGGPRFSSRGNVEVDEKPKLIPKLIHQTYKSSNVPKSVQPFMQSWRRLNEDWEIRFYDDDACLDFVKREFPEYLDAYRGLPKHVERSDFFRYMVVLRLGGVYADIDTECRQPLNSLLRARGYACRHPALREICDHIARNAQATYSDNTNVDTLEKTGPGIWTDVVLKHARLHPPSNVCPGGSPLSLGTCRVFADACRGTFKTHDPGIVVMHHFYGSWKVRGGWGRGLLIDKLVRLIFPGAAKRVHTGKPLEQFEEEMEDALPHEVKGAKRLYPVDIQWKPGFTMLVNLVGHGDPQLKQTSTGQVCGPDRRGGCCRFCWTWERGWAAARGHRVVAFEMSPTSLEPFRASIAYNGFEKLIQVHEAALRLQGVTVPRMRTLLPLKRGCVSAFARRKPGGGFVPPDVEVGAIRISATGWEGWVIEGLKAIALQAPSSEPPLMRTLAPRFYACPSLACRPRSPMDRPGGGRHTRMCEVLRRHAPGVILVELHPSAVEATGYLGGALRLLQDLYSWGYTDVSHSGYAPNAKAERYGSTWLHSYWLMCPHPHASPNGAWHGGRSVCDERWHNITGKFRMRRGLGVSADLFKQPTWCRLAPASFLPLIQRASPKFPENILFTYRDVPAATTTVSPPPPPPTPSPPTAVIPARRTLLQNRCLGQTIPSQVQRQDTHTQCWTSKACLPPLKKEDRALLSISPLASRSLSAKQPCCLTESTCREALLCHGA